MSYTYPASRPFPDVSIDSCVEDEDYGTTTATGNIMPVLNSWQGGKPLDSNHQSNNSNIQCESPMRLNAQGTFEGNVLLEPEILILDLFKSDDSEEVGRQMLKIQQRLQGYDDEVFYAILNILVSDRESAENKGLLLEALAGARVSQYANAVFQEIVRALFSVEETMRCRAIASASDLPIEHKKKMATLIRISLRFESCLSVKGAAEAFLDSI